MDRSCLKLALIGLAALLAGMCPPAIFADPKADTGVLDMETLIAAREEFRYEVTYGFLTLGWIEIRLLADTDHRGEKAYHQQILVESNLNVPFVGEKRVSYENLFRYNDRWPYSLEFWKDEIHDRGYDRERIVFDRERGVVDFYEDGEHTGSLPLEEPASAGDILFHYSRLFAGRSESYRLPVYDENELGFIEASSGPETETREYEAFDEPVPAYVSEGVADFSGPFGLAGRFRAWYSADEYRIPLEARLNVIFGNVRVSLVDYRRHGAWK